MAVDALSHGTTATAFGFGLWLGSGLVPHVTRVMLSLCSGQTSHTLEPRHDGRDATNGGVARAEAQVWA